MSAGDVRDRVAAKVATLAHAGVVYSNGSYASAGDSVSEWPSTLLDNKVHALVRRGATGRGGGTGNQMVTRTIDVEWRFSALALAEAERLIDVIEDEIIVAFSSDLDLGGAVYDCVYDGSDRPFEDEDEDERPWVVWVAHFSARERWNVEMTP